MTLKKLEEIFKDGYPINLFKNGDVFVGKAKNDNPDGPGYLIKVDGTLFKGHFDEGIFNGPLVMISEDKKVFGGFIKGKKHSEFQHLIKDKTILIETYEMDLILQSETIKEDGQFSSVNYKNGKMHGKYKLLMNNGDFFEFYYENGKKINHPKTNTETSSTGITQAGKDFVNNQIQKYKDLKKELELKTQWTLPIDVMNEIDRIKKTKSD